MPQPAKEKCPALASAHSAKVERSESVHGKIQPGGKGGSPLSPTPPPTPPPPVKPYGRRRWHRLSEERDAAGEAVGGAERRGTGTRRLRCLH